MLPLFVCYTANKFDVWVFALLALTCLPCDDILLFYSIVVIGGGDGRSGNGNGGGGCESWGLGGMDGIA